MKPRSGIFIRASNPGKSLSSGFCEIGSCQSLSFFEQVDHASTPQQNGEIELTGKKFKTKKFTREEWLAMDSQTLNNQLESLDKEYPLVLDTEAGRSFSAVRRMKAEKEIAIPINLRTGFAVSVKTGKAANEILTRVEGFLQFSF
jgi:hypothetical protein